MKRLLLIVLAGCAAMGLAPEQNRVTVTFTPAGKDPKFEAAADEYPDIWAKEGSRIIDSMERISALKFREKTIKAHTYEGPSFSGRGKAPMRLRSSADYDKLWTEALAMTPAERAGRLKQFVQEHRK
jgi:hypothetical protein